MNEKQMEKPVDAEIERIKTQLQGWGVFILCLAPASLLPVTWSTRFLVAIFLVVTIFYLMAKWERK